MVADLVEVDCPVCRQSVFAPSRAEHVDRHTHGERAWASVRTKVGRLKALVWT